MGSCHGDLLAADEIATLASHLASLTATYT